MNKMLSFDLTGKIRKMGVSALLLATGFLAITLIPENANAHGFVEKPTSRAALCSSNYGALNKSCGNVMYEPQSLEGLKGFPQRGPIDGKIASAGGHFGGILDQQSTNRWYKNTLTGGVNTFTWKYTAPHSTSKWHYYITKKGWNPNRPLTRASFEPIGVINHNGTPASTNLSHKINLPTDRSGYHVILAVWDVADTANAFYSVIDVNLINGNNSSTVPPTQPTDTGNNWNPGNTNTTKEQSSSFNQWDPYKAYTKGARVTHQNRNYEAVQSHRGYGDPNWIYALSLWKEI